jgi:sulfhydrogenase subunit gamma (sulfur reductase)
MSETVMTKSEESIYLPEPARILNVQTLTAWEKLFKLELPGGRSLGHRPGQFVEVSVLGVGEAPISITSSPSRSNGTFELCARRAGDMTAVLHTMKPGQTVGIRGPFGHGAPYERFMGKDILFVCAGLGLAPLRSLINQVLDERGKYDRVIILYGCKHPSEILFQDELDEWAARSDVEFHMTVDRPDENWKGNVGVITTLFPKIKVYARNTVAAVVGPPVVYRFALMELLGKGIPEGNIWMSLERRMKCGVGKCGHCQMNHVYTCQSGPWFSYTEIKGIEEAL